MFVPKFDCWEVCHDSKGSLIGISGTRFGREQLLAEGESVNLADFVKAVDNYVRLLLTCRWKWSEALQNKIEDGRNWYARYKEPPVKQMNLIGSSDWVEFVRQSDKITPMIYRKLRDHVGDPLSEKRILDFGCGVGRVALQLRARWGAPSHCRDVNRKAIKYLRKQLKDADCDVNDYEPPLDIASNSLDGVYSVSLWTHLAPEFQLPWLQEIARVLKPSGVALITTSGALAVRMRGKRGVPGWEHLGVEDLKREGLLYQPYQKNPGERGLHHSYGLVAHDPDWIRKEWGQILEVVQIHERVIDGIQDLVILRKS
jgi:SAM-dependent methyltransferase